MRRSAGAPLHLPVGEVRAALEGRSRRPLEGRTAAAVVLAGLAAPERLRSIRAELGLVDIFTLLGTANLELRRRLELPGEGLVCRETGATWSRVAA